METGRVRGDGRYQKNVVPESTKLAHMGSWRLKYRATWDYTRYSMEVLWLLAWQFCGAVKIGRGYISDNFGSLGSTFSPTELPFQPSLMKTFTLPYYILLSAFCLLSFAGLFFSG